MRRVSYLLLLILLMVACSERRAYVEALGRAKAVLGEHPSEALAILDSLGTHESDFGKHFRMQYRLLRLNTLNKLDTVFHSTTEAQTLADYFDDHGTSNEQMLAHYLLGRAYYDLHEAPMALHSFQEAAEKADTTASDCDYRQLSRVYGQMGKLFYHQDLLTQSLFCDDMSIKYAFKGKDILNAILSMIGQTATYEDLHQTDSSIYIGELASDLALKYGYKEISAAIYGGLVDLLIDKGDLIKAKRYMDRYELESGYFDSDHNIEKGRETYYYTKGHYFFAIGRYDSAEYYYRKELLDGKDFNNQNGGSRGLALLFQKTNQPDSAAKYALYSYTMNDSVYAQMSTHEVEQMQGMYDYSRNQEIAHEEMKKREKIESKNRTMANITIALLIAIIATLYLIKRERKKRKEEHFRYDESVSKLAKAQEELNKLRSHREEYERWLRDTRAKLLKEESISANQQSELDKAKSDIEQLHILVQDLSQMIGSKEKEVVRLNGEVELYKEKVKTQKINAEAKFEEFDIYKQLKKTAARAEVVKAEEWQNINAMVIKVLPNFYKLISSNKHKLNDNEFKTCILIRLLFIPKEIAIMLNLSQPSITKIRNNLMQKLFDEDGNSKELDKKLREYS
ncbi:MAG: hypothetical protein E7103_00500 [Prevotella sp.]|nr:hypothetical protein [Prevotella sp.]